MEIIEYWVDEIFKKLRQLVTNTVYDKEMPLFCIAVKLKGKWMGGPDF